MNYYANDNIQCFESAGTGDVVCYGPAKPDPKRYYQVDPLSADSMNMMEVPRPPNMIPVKKSPLEMKICESIAKMGDGGCL